PLDDILQFANVARPIIRKQQSFRRRRESLYLPLTFLSALYREVMRQQDNVIPPVAKRRHGHRNNIEPVIQIGGKAAVFERSFQFPIRSGDQPDVYFYGASASDPLKLARL